MRTERPRRRRPTRWAVLLTVGLAVAGCAPYTTATPAAPPPSTIDTPTPSPTPTPVVDSPTPVVDTPTPMAPPTPTVPIPTAVPTQAKLPPAEVSKVLVFVVENKSFEQMRTNAPYIYSQARTYGYATNFKAIRHPSLPNYIAMASGSTHGITDDGVPSAHKIDSPSVFGKAIAAGRTAGAYADGMPDNCSTSNGGKRYVARHNPWTYFTAERSDCKKFNVPFSQFDEAVADGGLPDIAFAVANNCHNAHDDDCSISDADDWFETQMKKVYAGPDWTSGRLAVILTADEDDKKSDNKILTVVIHPSQKGNVVDSPLSLYSLSRFFSEVTHTEPLANARTAPSMATAFKLPIA